VDFPYDIIRVFASFVQVVNLRYISGLRFQIRTGQNLCLGYVRPRDEQIIDLGAPTGNEKELFITVFTLAADLRGVRGLTVVTSVEWVSMWVGEHKGIPQRRLVADSRITSLKADFDVRKPYLGISMRLTVAGNENGLSWYTNDGFYPPISNSQLLY
jgi:hypothetical protein